MTMTLTSLLVALVLLSIFRRHVSLLHAPQRAAVTVRVLSIAALLALPLLAPAATRAQDQVDAGAQIAVENTDGVPFNDRLIFSRIQNATSVDRSGNPYTFGVHDTVTLRVRNTGTSELVLNSLTLSSTSDWQIVSAGDSRIPAGGSTSVVVQFVTQRNTAIGCATKCVRIGTLTIASNDATRPSLQVQLAGFWQDVSEGGDNVEPTLQEVMQVFGYTTTITGAGQQLFNKGQVTTVGEEVLAPYWQRANSSQPVRVRQLAAFHGNDNYQTEELLWHEQDSRTNTSVLVHAGRYGQTLLPPIVGSTTAPAEGTFSPAGRFGFVVKNEYSDPTRNNQANDRAKGCPARLLCGHHLRFWPARDRAGQIMPNTYILAQDYINTNSLESINYDFQDNIYLITNIQPGGTTGTPETRQALYRIDVAGMPYTDTNGRVWQSDRNLFTPTDLENEVPDGSGIANTADDLLYRSYRGKTGTNPTSFVLPTRGLTQMDLRLHFAERFHSASGRRIFDVNAEGATILNDFDIFADAGARNRAVVKEFSNIAVTDGTLNLDFIASVDNASIAAIEVLCPGDCPTGSDTTPPAAPTGLIATATATGVNLDWNDNGEADLKGYNVYRSINGAAATKINPALITKPTSQFTDSSAPENVPLSYFVRAVDNSNNESAASNTATATRTPPPNLPPAAPANLTATASASGIALDWNGNSEADLAGYNVYRSLTGAAGSFAKIATVNKPTSSYNDTLTDETVTYHYYVTAVDTANQESAPSATRSATRPNTTPPAMPLELSALARNDGILLDWTDNTESDLVSYEVYRGTSATGSFTRIATVNKPTSQYLDTAAPRAQVSYYQVRAVDTAGNKSQPATASAMRPSMNAPAPPVTSGRLIRLQGGSVVLEWADSPEGDLKGYNVYRSTSASGPFQKLNPTPLTTSTFTDSALPASPTLFYRIMAVDTTDLESAPLLATLERGWAAIIIR